MVLYWLNTNQRHRLKFSVCQGILFFAHTICWSFENKGEKRTVRSVLLELPMMLRPSLKNAFSKHFSTTSWIFHTFLFCFHNNDPVNISETALYVHANVWCDALLLPFGYFGCYVPSSACFEWVLLSLWRYTQTAVAAGQGIKLSGHTSLNLLSHPLKGFSPYHLLPVLQCTHKTSTEQQEASLSMISTSKYPLYPLYCKYFDYSTGEDTVKVSLTLW